LLSIKFELVSLAGSSEARLPSKVGGSTQL
jgi:hypothetical protein